MSNYLSAPSSMPTNRIIKMPEVYNASFQQNGLSVENFDKYDHEYHCKDKDGVGLTPQSTRKPMNPLSAVVMYFQPTEGNSDSHYFQNHDRNSHLFIPYERIIAACLMTDKVDSRSQPSIKAENDTDSKDIHIDAHDIYSANRSTDDSIIQVTYLVDSGKDLIPKKMKVRIEKTPSIPSSGNVDILSDEIQNKNIPKENLKMFEQKCNLHYLNKKYLIIINPNGGKGEAMKIFNTHIKLILDAAEIDYTIIKTEYYKHCVDIISKMENLINYDVIACCSGDGIPHEVINGIYSRIGERVELFNKITVTQLPCGSGNAFSLSCHKTMVPSHAVLSMLKSPTIKMDLMAITQPSGDNGAYKTSLSFLSQTYGLIADADMGTEWLRYMGPSRFDLGVTYKVLRNAKYPCKLQVKYRYRMLDDIINSFEEYYKEHKSEEDASKHLITEEDLTVKMPCMNEDLSRFAEWHDVANMQHLQVFYTGKMPYIAKDTQFFPAALPNDGCMDLVIMESNSTGFFETAKILTSLDSGNQIFSDGFKYSKIEGYRLTPIKHNFISVDGENFPMEPTQGEVLHKVLKTISKDATFEKTILSKD